MCVRVCECYGGCVLGMCVRVCECVSVTVGVC